MNRRDFLTTVSAIPIIGTFPTSSFKREVHPLFGKIQKINFNYSKYSNIVTITFNRHVVKYQCDARHYCPKDLVNFYNLCHSNEFTKHVCYNTLNDRSEWTYCKDRFSINGYNFRLLLITFLGT